MENACFKILCVMGINHLRPRNWKISDTTAGEDDTSPPFKWSVIIKALSSWRRVNNLNKTDTEKIRGSDIYPDITDLNNALCSHCLKKKRESIYPHIQKTPHDSQRIPQSVLLHDEAVYLRKTKAVLAVHPDLHSSHNYTEPRFFQLYSIYSITWLTAFFNFKLNVEYENLAE